MYASIYKEQDLTEDKNKKGDLKNEKDFIDLAKKNAEKVSVFYIQ